MTNVAKEFNIYKKKWVLSQATIPKLQYKIQIQLNEIILYLNFNLNVFVIISIANITLYPIASKFFSLKICFPSEEYKKLMRSA